MDVRKEEARDISGMSTDKTVKWQSLKVGAVSCQLVLYQAGHWISRRRVMLVEEDTKNTVTRVSAHYIWELKARVYGVIVEAECESECYLGRWVQGCRPGLAHKSHVESR